MRYNIFKILCKTTLALLIVSYGIKPSLAQSTISLSDDIDGTFSTDDNSSGVSLFDNEDDFDNGLLQPGKVSSNTSLSDIMAETADESNDALKDIDSFEGFVEPENTISFASEQDDLDDLSDFNELVGTSTTSKLPTIADDNFGEDILSQIDDTIFSQMSSIEKQTALLTLELRREKIKNEIEAIKFQRRQAIENDEVEQEKKRREKQEWENDQERKTIAEQTKLQEAELKLEKLRQEKAINAYKNEMLKTNQKWIETLGEAYKSSKRIEEERQELINDFKNKLVTLASMAKGVGSEATTAQENYFREVQNLQTQISILSSRVETLNAEKIEGSAAGGIDNPFSSAPGFGTTSDPNIKLSDEYIILEIKGKGDNLTARISNKTGAETFLVHRGTTLKSGHVIEEVSPTFIRASKSGEKDYIYFSAGGILDKEPDSDIKTRMVLGSEHTRDGVSADRASDGSTRVNISDNFMEQMFAE